MKIALTATTLLCLAACVATRVEPEVVAVRDLIALSDLQEVDNFRVISEMNVNYVNDYYVATIQGGNNYLLEFRKKCRSLRRSRFDGSMVDYRRDATHIHTKWDTVRGCQIDRIYSVTDEQLVEILTINNAAQPSALRKEKPRDRR